MHAAVLISGARGILRRLICVLVFAGIGLGTLAASPGQTPSVGERFPPLASFDLEGPLPNLAGARVVVVDFWASWCGPCKASFAAFEELREQFGDRGLVIVAVNVDENPEAMRKFLQQHPVEFAVVRDGQQRLVQTVSPPAMPTSFILDAEGVVRAVHHGFHGRKSRDALAETISHLLASNP